MEKIPHYSVKKHFSITSFFYAVTMIVSIALCCIVIVDIYRFPENYPSFIPYILLSILLCSTYIYFYVRKIGSRDKLTGVLIQSSFVKKAFFKQLRGTLKEYNAVFINLKGYKYINQLLGARAADAILAKYARKLQKYLKHDELVARLGGDNFIILIQKKRLSGFLHFIQKIVIEQEINNSTQIFPISCYAGVATLTEDDKVTEVLSKSAFALQHIRERKTGNFLFYNDEIENKILEQNRISFLFQSALENGEFKVYYQPKVDVNTKKLTGCEALIRWEHNGIIEYPSAFVPTLEKTGLITYLDYYVLNKVCREINSWKTKGFTCVPVSINFSKHHLRNPHFTEEILQAIIHNNTDKSLIEIELTESENFEDYDSLIKFIKHMYNNGIRTSIDDFGIGYSSLALLKNENVRIVKIDKSFVEKIAENDGNNTHSVLLKSMITTCHELGKDVICEGIETPEQLAILKGLDCSIIQGFYFDKPLTTFEFESRLRNPIY